MALRVVPRRAGHGSDQRVSGHEQLAPVGLPGCCVAARGAVITDLLDLAKIEAGCVEVTREPVDLVGIARQAARLAEPSARAKGLRLRTDFSAPEIEVYADRDKIAQAFTNLLANALKFTEAGEVLLTVEELGAQVACAVRDTGSGIAPDDLPKVFQKFYQAGRPAPGGAKGTGLGLSIAKALVELHGGTISATSELGVGTTFTFLLPKPLVEGRRHEREMAAR